MKIGKWSDGEKWVTDRDGASEESEEVITRSRMWFWLWVGKFTCWVKLNDDRRERNWEVAWSEWLSRWMLKSTVMMNLWGVVAAKERKELNSLRKTEKRFGEGGRRRRTIDIEYRTGIFEWGSFRVTEYDSKEQNSVCEIGSCVKGSRIRNPVPPPTTWEDVFLEEVLGKLSREYRE